MEDENDAMEQAEDTVHPDQPDSPEEESVSFPPPPPPPYTDSPNNLRPDSSTRRNDQSQQVKDPLIGFTVEGRYRITGRIARGGMGTVYVAHDERLDRDVAVKIMHPHLAESPDFVTRFGREARAAARILHSGVVSVFDQGISGGQGFLVMELISGPNLRTVLSQHHPLTVSQALTYTIQVLDALNAAHIQGIVHRDIKPENILLHDNRHVKVTDFGLAYAASQSSLSTTGTMLGTVSYMAPEMATTGIVDARTDIYATGIVLYEMLTGKTPWDGSTAIQTAYKHVNQDIPSPSDTIQWLPKEIDDVVASLTAREPNERPLDAREAINLVEDLINTLPTDILSRQTPNDLIPTPANKDHNEIHGEATVAIAKPLLTEALPSLQNLTPAPQKNVNTSSSSNQVDERPGKRPRLHALLVAILVLLIGTGGIGWWWTQYGPGSYVSMPKTQGQPVKTVVSNLEKLKLHVIITERFSDTVKTGIVISSTPIGGSQVHKGAKITVVASKGIDMKSMPKVTGLSLEDARKAIITAGLKTGHVTEEYSETVPLHKVINQSVESEKSIPHDTTVDLSVSLGREPITVPDLSGLTADDARVKLEKLDLVPTPQEDFSATVPKGKIISQEQASGSTLHHKDSVTYSVSKGPELVAIPGGLIGKQIGEVEKTLKDLGFKVEINRIVGGFFGTVRSTNPESGKTVPAGSTITVTVV